MGTLKGDFAGEGSGVFGDRLVALSCPLDGDFTKVTTEVLRADASVVGLADLQDRARRDAVRRAEVLISWHPERELPAGSLREAAGLRFVQLISAGVDHVDLAVIPARAAVAGNAGAYAPPIAEHVLAMTLALAKRLRRRQSALRRGDWEQQEPQLTLDGADCAILGFGGIGQATARLMRAFGARIHAVNSSGRTSEPVESVHTLAGLDRVLAAADVVVVALPLTVATRDLLDARRLRLMKPTAILVNVGRAAVVDQRALYEHLRDHPDFGAGIDVWWHEPGGGERFRPDYPFLSLPNVIGSPHNAGSVPGTMARAARQAAENVRRYLRGEQVRGLTRRADYARPG